MTIRDIISNTDALSEEVVIYARKVDGRFEDSSEIVLLELPDEDLELLTKDVSEKYCPGFDYFLEGFIIKEMVEEIRTVPEYQTVDQQVKRVIYYAEFDA
ncbi:MAG TPA: hypothetical protein VFT06_03675 [Flavisolibacter sp.]|nr:hypothetical protein [Flavisolibacter sp.]